MKRFLSVLAIASLVAFAAVAFASDDHSGHDHASKSKSASSSSMGSKASSWTGEILDAGCYLGHGAMGAKHTECAVKCAANGMPIMLLTKEGKAILLTPPHDNADAYNKAKEMAGTMAVITGTLSERGGVKGITVTGVAAAK